MVSGPSGATSWLVQTRSEVPDKAIPSRFLPDGNTAIIGGSADNRIIGAAWVYTRSGGVLTAAETNFIQTAVSRPH